MNNLPNSSPPITTGSSIPPPSKRTPKLLSKRDNAIQYISKNKIKAPVPQNDDKSRFAEEKLVRILEEILKNRRPMLIMDLGSALHAQNKDASAHIKENFRGLLDFLLKHNHIFSISGARPYLTIDLNSDTSRPSAPFVSNKEAMLLAKHKTAQCEDFLKKLPCQHKFCTFVHENEEIRRNPFLPFSVSYQATLCPAYQKNEENKAGICDHGQDCLHCRNMIEFIYHPENYRTKLCGPKCKQYLACPNAHDPFQFKRKITLESSSVSLAYLARNQHWDQLIARLQQLPVDSEASAKIISEDVYPFSRETALHYAAKYCKSDVIELLLKFPLDLNQQDAFGQTPIHKAAAYGGGGDEKSDWQRTCELLIQNNADPLIKDYQAHDGFYFAKLNTATRPHRALVAKMQSLREKYISSDPEQARPQELYNPYNVDEAEEYLETSDDLSSLPQQQQPISIPKEESEIKPLRANAQVGSYIKDASVSVKESKLTEFKASSKSRNSIKDIVGLHLMKNFVAFLNGLEPGEIGKIYFGIDDAGKITGTILKKEECALLQQAIKQQLDDIKPPVTSQEYEIHIVPVHEHDTKCPIENLFVIEIHIKSGSHPIYFNSVGQCWVRRPAGVHELSAEGITNLFISRLQTKIVSIPANPVIPTLDENRLKVMSGKEIEELYLNHSKALETDQKLLEIIKNTLREKKQASLAEQKRKIVDLKKQLESLKT
jgi:Putative DNA-binding domain/Ankyrin repeats (3 copies)